MSRLSENESESLMRWQSLQLRVFEFHIEEIFELFYRHQIDPIMIKGWAAARYYPFPERRFTSDIDLAVSTKDFPRATEIIRGYPFNVDLHRELRHLDILGWDDLFENSELIDLGKTKVRVLRREDHLRVLCVHWLNDGGVDKKKLWDIYYALENRPNDFNWQRFLDSVGEKRRKWFLCVVGLTQKYLGLSLKNSPVDDAASALPEWLIRTVEKEWQSEVRLTPLQRSLQDKKAFWRQIKKRIPPNPIQATVELEGEFDDTPRFYYQFVNVFTRLMPAIKRITRVLFKRGK
jgi:hypothetical protein